MLRRVLQPSAAKTGAIVHAAAGYRIMPHIHRDVEELAEAQSSFRWSVSARNATNLQGPPRQSETMCDRLNFREARRQGKMPEKSIIRRISEFYAVDGRVQEPHYKTKWMNITIIGFDGHPYHFRLVPMPDVTLNALIDGSGMASGWMNCFQRCQNPDCQDFLHGEGCMVNVDIDTLDKLTVPSRFEYFQLANWRMINRGDIRYNTRFSCQIKLVEELDGAVFALKQFFSKSLRETAMDWGEDDNYSVAALHKSRKVEPWAPMVEEPTRRDFPITYDLLWVKDHEEVLKYKYPNYKRRDGFHTRPDVWAWWV